MARLRALALEISAFVVALAVVALAQAGLGPLWLRAAVFVATTAALTGVLIEGWRRRRLAIRAYVASDVGPEVAFAARPDAPGYFDELVGRALDDVPAELRNRMSNVEIVVEGEPPAGAPWLGLYHGIPLTRRGDAYAGAWPDKITIYRGPLERLYGHDPARLAAEVRHTVVHEIAHHFGISDERLVEMDRY
jgi:predicted Zn-dependent protease with MMP-like domain